jgi:hypothetical protein
VESSRTPLFELPLADWTWASVHDFLCARIAENDRIEYKQSSSDNLTDTLVSMANGYGGYIFLGVSEVGATKTPKDWPLLKPDFDHAKSVLNRAASETSPPVPLEVKKLGPPDSDRHVVVVKIGRGTYPPYFAKNRGVKVRSGDADIHADPPILEWLFAQREEEEVRAELRRNRARRVFGDLSGKADSLALYIYAEPIPLRPALLFNEEGLRLARNLVRLALNGLDPIEHRSGSQIEFRGQSDDRRLIIFRDGAVGYSSRLLDDASAERPPLGVHELSQAIVGVLTILDNLAKSAGLVGNFYVRFSLASVYNRPLAWAQSAPFSAQRRRQPMGFGDFVVDDLPYTPLSDPLDFVRSILKELCFRMGYEDYEELIDQFGRSVSERRGK